VIHFSLFSGIGGFELASEQIGWINYLSCDINEFGNKILEYYWPNAYHHNDIHTLNYQIIDNELSKRYGSQWRTDDIIITGGFPCQPYSAAGKRLGKDDDRHLWPEMLRVIREVKPTWVVGENVLGLVSWNDGMVFNEVQADLEAEGYELQAFVLPAASVNAPHRRDRIWFVAYSSSFGCNHRSNNWQERYVSNDERITEKSKSEWQGRKCRSCEVSTTTSNTNCTGFQEAWSEQPARFLCTEWQDFPTQSPICSGDDGFPTKLDGITFSKWRNESIKAYGNAIVPQVALQVFRAIDRYMIDFN
jgi:DNA (cytosine-5)-methyltransferase 1